MRIGIFFTFLKGKVFEDRAMYRPTDTLFTKSVRFLKTIEINARVRSCDYLVHSVDFCLTLLL